MTPRERFLKILSFEPVDRTLNWEFGYWGGALNRWRGEGLPIRNPFPRALTFGEGVAGPGLHWPILSLFDGFMRDSDVSSYFHFDGGVDLVPFNCWVEPKYDKVILREEEETQEVIDENGVQKLEYKDGRSMPHFVSFPVKSRSDWERVREERLQFSFRQRVRGNLDSLKKHFTGRTTPLGILGEPAGFYGSLRLLMGEEALLFSFYDQPGLVREMMNYLANLWIAHSLELVRHFDVDVAYFWEDMCGRNGPSISPAMFREFMLPPYRRIIDALKSSGIRHFIVDNDGQLDTILPLFIECGITGIYPVERQPGNDLRAIRARYPTLQILGGINKTVLAADPRRIDEELKGISEMIGRGGFVPFADHTIPPNVSWDNFVHYRKRLEDLIGGTSVL